MGASTGISSTGIGALAAGQGIMALGNAYNQSEAQRSQGEFQRAQYEENSKLAGIQAQDALYRGDEQVAASDSRTKKMIGAEQTSAAASGIDSNFGSSALIQNDTRTLGALDALTLKNNAWREAWGYKMQASQLSSQGAFASMASKNSATNTLLTGGMQALGYGGQAAYLYNGGGKASAKSTD